MYKRQMRWSKLAEDISSHSHFVAFFQVGLFLPQISGSSAFVGKVFATRQEIEKLSIDTDVDPTF